MKMMHIISAVSFFLASKKFFQTGNYKRLTCGIFFVVASTGSTAQKMDTNVLKQNLYKHVSALAHDSMQGRFTGSPEMYAAADYIRKEFIEAGLQVVKGHEEYLDTFSHYYDGAMLNGVNVLACIPGTTRRNEYVFFSAHYDHCGTSYTNPYLAYNSPNQKDTIFNGANDNASGVAALIEIAKVYAHMKERPERTIIFIAFAGEELGLVGSTHFRNTLLNPYSIKLNLTMDMLGIFDGKGLIVTGHEYSNLRKKLNDNLDSLGVVRKKPYFLKDSGWENYFVRSDNYPFAEIGIVSHCLLGGSGKKNYHRVSDEIATLNFDKLTEAVELIIIACGPILQGQEIKLTN